MLADTQGKVGHHNQLKFTNVFLNQICNFFPVGFHKNQNDQTWLFIVLSFFHAFFVFSLISSFPLHPYQLDHFLRHLTINLTHSDPAIHSAKIVSPSTIPKLSQAIDSRFLDLIHIFFITQYFMMQAMKKVFLLPLFSYYLESLKN